jgi:hypothetical protein
MPSITRNTTNALGQLLGAVGAAGNVLTKSMMALDRLTDAGYSHSDTFAVNTELRNQGSIKDAVLDEEKRDLERTIERMKFEEQLNAFIAAHPELSPATDSSSKTKPSKNGKTKGSTSSAQAA